MATKGPQTDNQVVINEAKLIEGLATESLTDKVDAARAANGLAKEAHSILSSPCRNFMDALNVQLVSDRQTDSSLPEITIEHHDLLRVKQGISDREFTSDGTVEYSAQDKLATATGAHSVDDTAHPQYRDFLQP